MASRYDVAGRVVLVTGAARGIGAQTARVLSARGARLSLVGLEPDLLVTLCSEMGSRHVWFEADVTNQQALDAAVSATADRLGGIDVVVANAGLVSYGTVRQLDPEAFARTIDVNLTGVYRTAHAAMPHLLERKGYFLVVASLASFAPIGGLPAYCASKAGVESLALAMRQEVSHLEVEVGVSHPSWTDTEMIRDAMADLPTLRRIRRLLPWPVRSTTSAEECAEAIADGIARRARRVYVPRSLALVQIGRSLVTSGITERLVRGKLAELMPAFEADVASIGRAYGLNASVAEPASSSAEVHRPGSQFAR